MKLCFYVDVFPWTNDQNPGMVWTGQPTSPKPPECKRYKIEFEVEDPTQTDEVLQVEAKGE